MVEVGSDTGPSEGHHRAGWSRALGRVRLPAASSRAAEPLAVEAFRGEAVLAESALIVVGALILVAAAGLLLWLILHGPGAVTPKLTSPDRCRSGRTSPRSRGGAAAAA
jgi:hypothetical protein